MKKMKTIQKIFGLLPMMAAALALIACSSEDNTIETPQTGNPTEQDAVKTIAYSVTVSGGNATTRATVDADNKTLRFAAGDVLYIASDSRDDIKGALTLKAGDEDKTSGATFEGSLTYTGAAPADDLELKAILVGSSNAGIGISDGKVTGITYPTTAFCTDVNDAVEKYSLLTGTSTYAARTFSLSQGTAFLNFTLTLNDGTATATDITATVTNGATTLSTATVTTAMEDEKVVAKFVLPVAASTVLSGATVSVSGSNITAVKNIDGASPITLSAKVYNVNRTKIVKGDFLNKDGSITTTKQTSGDNESYAVIAYVGSVANYFSRFLDLALTDAYDGTCNWSAALTAVGTYASNHPVTIGGTAYNTSTTGSTYYDKVASNTGSASNTATAAQTGWRLPSVSDWRYVMQGLCGGPSATSPVGILDNNWYYVNTLDEMVSSINTACGNTAFQKTAFYSSSESDTDNTKAWWYGFQYGKFGCTAKTFIMNARAVFAF